jgi:hypothetical protein
MTTTSETLEKETMNVGDTLGTLTVTHIVYRRRKDGTQGAPLLVDVRCKCGVEKTLPVGSLTRKRSPQRSCGGKGCKKKGPVNPKPNPDIWYCQRRGALV